MSSGGYEVPHFPSTFARYEPRRASASFSGPYDRPPVGMAPRRSPSPGPSRRTYDSYVPPRPTVSYRDEHSNSYRPPNIYRPDYPSNNLYSRSPSPDRYVTPGHSADPESYERQIAWQSSPYAKPIGWQERKPVPPSPTTSVRSRGQRDDTLATRMFEPSENWKHIHTDRPGRSDGPSYSTERHSDSSSRGIQDFTSDSLRSRSASRSSIPPGGDRYRPAPPRSNSIGNVREYDSYRPDGERDPRNPELRSANSFRRDLPSGSNRWDHYEPVYSDQHPSHFLGSPDRRPNDYVGSSPIRSDVSGRRYDQDPRTVRVGLSRRSSRSSIASTHVSDLPPPPSKGHVHTNSADSSLHSREPSDSNNRFSSPRPDFVRSLAKPLQPSEDSASAKPLSSPIRDQRAANGRIPGLDTSGFVPEQKLLAVEQSGGSAGGMGDRFVLPGTNQSSVHVEAQREVNGHSTALRENAPQTPKHDHEMVEQSPPPSDSPGPETISPAGPSNLIVEGLKEETPAGLVPPDTTSETAEPLLSTANGEFGADQTFDIPDAVPSLPSPLFEAEPEGPVPVEDTSEVLLQLKPLFPPELPLVTETPSLLNAKSFPEALRAVVMTRLMGDRQPRASIINPVLVANYANAANTHIHPTLEGPISTPESLIDEVMGGKRERVRLEVFEAAQPSFAEHFEQRRSLVTEKIQRLSREYLALHDRWRAHCAALSDHQRSIFSSEHEGLHISGRATRRTTAITDAVRSDLEMEQIIASLGNDDAMDPNYMSMRNAATIPDMISVTQGQVDYVFDDTNHLVENPSEYFAPDTGIDDWTVEEKRVFIDRFAQFPKQFGVIAESIPHKTASQCVDYYYLHKKRQIDFRKVVAQLGPKKKKRRGGGKKKGNALLADIAQHDAEVGKNLSSFVVPTRVTVKGKRGPGRPPKVRNNDSVAGGGSDKAAVHSATATPQPESRSSARLNGQALFLDSLTDPATPEPETRLRRKKAAATRATAPTSSVSATPLSVSSVSAVVAAAASVSTVLLPPPSAVLLSSPVAAVAVAVPETEPDAMDVSEAVSETPTPLSAPAPAASRARTPPPSATPVSRPPAPFPVAPTHSGASSHTKTEDDDATADLDARPVKRTKRGRKQVKSVAIIHDEPVDDDAIGMSSPPPPRLPPAPKRSSLSGGQLLEPSSVLTKATKILSDFEEARKLNENGGASTSVVEKSVAGKSDAGKRAKNEDNSNYSNVVGTDFELELDGDLLEAEKSKFIDAFIFYGPDIDSLASEVPGRSIEEVERFYRLNEDKLDVDEMRRKYTEAQAEDSRVMESRRLAYLRENREGLRFGYQGSQPPRGTYPDYPNAIPFKPKARKGSAAAKERRQQQQREEFGAGTSTMGYGGAGGASFGPYGHHPYASSVASYGYHYPPQYHSSGVYTHHGQHGAYDAHDPRSHSVGNYAVPGVVPHADVGVSGAPLQGGRTEAERRRYGSEYLHRHPSPPAGPPTATTIRYPDRHSSQSTVSTPPYPPSY